MLNLLGFTAASLVLMALIFYMATKGKDLFPDNRWTVSNTVHFLGLVGIFKLAFTLFLFTLAAL